MPDTPSVSLSIQGFGILSIMVDGQPISDSLPRKGPMLLLFLALHAGSETPCKDIAALFWPHSSKKQARYNLTRLLAEVQKALGAASVRLSPPRKPTLRLTITAQESDVVAFANAIRDNPALADLAHSDLAHSDDTIEQALNVPALEHIVSLYTGELCAGCHEGGQWLLSERETREQQYCKALRTLYRIALDGQNYHVALDRLGKLSCLEEMKPQEWQQAAETLLSRLENSKKVSTTDISTAASLYENLQASLQRIDGTGPDLAMQKLYSRISEEIRSRLRQGTDIPRIANLPCPLTRFFGREPEKTAIFHEITAGETRLLTLVNMGGMGKSRLAVEAGLLLTAHFLQSAWFVPLADPADTDSLISRIIRAVALQVSPDQDALAELAAFLNRKNSSLLILDNFEDMLIKGTPLLQALLQRVPSMTVIVTSRIGLGIPGERLMSVEPLPVPTDNTDLDALERVPSAEMFVNRMQSVNRHFALTAQNKPAVAAICKRLEGIPLALELAAAWGGVLTPAEMLAQLEDRFIFLTRSHAPHLARHPSLQAALLFSYDLLSPALRSFFTQLCVFHGGFTAEAAGAVCELPESLQVSVGLEALSRHSFLAMKDVEGEMRYSMLETLREFGLDEEKDEERNTALSSRHANYYDAKLTEAEPHLWADGQREWLEWIESEYANITSALVWEISKDSPRILLRPRLTSYWDVRSNQKEVCDWLRALLPAPQDTLRRSSRACLLAKLGSLCVSISDFTRAEMALKEALELFRAQGKQANERGVVINLAYWATQKGDCEQALCYYRLGKELAEAQGDPRNTALNLRGTAYILSVLGDYAAARRVYAETQVLYASLDDQENLALIPCYLGETAFMEQDYPAAVASWEEGLRRMSKRQNRFHSARCLFHIGDAKFALGDVTGAEDAYQKSLPLLRELKNFTGIAAVEAKLARLAAVCGQAEHAGRLLGRAEALWEQAGQLAANKLYDPDWFAVVWNAPEFLAARQQPTRQ